MKLIYACEEWSLTQKEEKVIRTNYQLFKELLAEMNFSCLWTQRSQKQI